MKFFYRFKESEEKSHTLIIHDAKFLRNKNFLARRDASFSFCPININKKLPAPLPTRLILRKNWPKSGSTTHSSVKGWSFQTQPQFPVMHLHLSGDMVTGQGTRGTVQRGEGAAAVSEHWEVTKAHSLQTQSSVWWPSASATHWASWRCLPWPSSSCFGLAGPCHALLFAHWWVDHIVLLWQTAEPQWKNAWTAPHCPSPSRAHYRALSSHPDNRLHLPHQTHSLPGRHR